MCTGSGIGWSCLQRKEGHSEQRHNSTSDWSRTALPSHVYKRTPQLSHHVCTEISTSLPSHVYKRTTYLSHHVCTREQHIFPITCVQENSTPLPSRVYKRTAPCISKRGTWMQSQTGLMPALLTLEPLVSCFTSKVGRAYVILSCPAACKQDVGQEVTIRAQEVTIQHRK